MVRSEVHNLNEGTTVFKISIRGGLSSDIHQGTETLDL